MKTRPGQYAHALRHYLRAGGEEALMNAYSIGRNAVCEGTSLVDFASMHLEVAAHEVAKALPEDRSLMRERADQFLTEALSPFEMELTGAKEMNDRLRRANLELDQASRLKSRFLSHVSHELRTPLNSVIGFGQLLQAEAAGPLNPKQRRYTENILSSGQSLLGLVNDILDLSKIEAGRMMLAMEQVSVNAVVAECVEAIQPLTLEKGLTLEVVGAAAQAEADRRRLAQVIRNLLSNAVKFTPEGGQIEVRTELEPETVRLVVVDSGVGIPLDEQERVFHEFAQVESEALRHAQGTGLGLPLTRRLVELMEGTVELTSEPGAGTSVAIRLRRAAEPA